jgi:hypothetical protein
MLDSVKGFLAEERQRLAALKARSSLFSEAARADGVYKGSPRPFCLPLPNAEENLFHEIRASAIDYFRKYSIKWHDGTDDKPSNHLCGSQVCCVNFLFPFSDKPQALVELFRPVFPSIRRVLPMEEPGRFVAFEWIGLDNYLGEKVRRGAKRTRGANFTSADAAVMFEHEDGLRQIALIEWKYTESYSGTPLQVADSGTSRVEIYRPLLEGSDCPLDVSLLGSLDDLFYEPFYQLMRQQLLAHEMERAKELGAKRVSLLHIAPAHNEDLLRVTSPALQTLGPSPTAIWKRLVRPGDRFATVSTEQLFGGLPIKSLPGLAPWWQYVSQRYSWVCEGARVSANEDVA